MAVSVPSQAKTSALEILNNIHNGIVAVDKNGRITVFNKTMERIFDYEAFRAIGSPIYEIIPYTGLLRVLSTGNPHIGRKFTIGENVYLANRNPIFHGEEVIGAVGVIQDITEFQSIVDELESVKSLKGILETVLDAAYDGLLVIDNDGYITMVNEAFAGILDSSPSLLVGKHVTRVVEDSRMPVVARTGIAELGEIQCINGHEVIVQRLPIIKEGQTIGAVGKIMFKDVAELNALAKKVNNLHNELAYYKDEVRKYRGTRYGLANLIGDSPVIRELKETIKRVSQSNSTVLIRGETGTGKELVAHAIHMESPRRYEPFIKVNCAAIPENLLESELFGYEDGAFTGAKKGGQIGKFQLANGGAIFLDEIGDMSLPLQAKLLRVLQEKEIERLGSVKVCKIDVRVICATNKNLEELVSQGQFREDLFYRFNVVNIFLEPLRKRREDLAGLVDHFCQKFNKEFARKVEGLEDKVWRLFYNYTWPGNIRELENVLERAFNVMEGCIVRLDNLPLYLQKQEAQDGLKQFPKLQSLLEEAEKKALIETLNLTRGNKAQAAAVLGISRAWLYRLLNKHRLPV